MALQHWTDLETINPQLQSLEDLARLSEHYGLVEVKPFRDWVNTAYKNKVFQMRLCNAGELLEMTSYCDSIPVTARQQALKMEIIIRSVWDIDGKRLVSDEEIASYNARHNSNITLIEYLRIWSRNLEQVVVDRLEAVYDALLIKQFRRIQGAFLCAACNTTFPSLPENSKRLRYSLGEVICSSCQPLADPTIYDFEDPVTEVKPNPAHAQAQGSAGSSGAEPSFGSSGYFCACGEEFDSLEDFTAHRETCKKADAVHP